MGRTSAAVFVERGSSAAEGRTRNPESPGSSPGWYLFEVCRDFSFSPPGPRSLSCINEYLAIYSGRKF